jgi:1,4-alpha-glucan branching enzyme
MRISAQAPWVSDYDLYLLGEGTHCRAYEKMGAHLGEVAGRRGVHFAAWAPNAEQVSVVGDFNEWNARSNALESRAVAGIWKGFVPDVGPGRFTSEFLAVMEHPFDGSWATTRRSSMMPFRKSVK